jgi:putative two-component system response regulator
LVILDFDMPNLTGAELAVLLRNTPEAREIPIIFLSGISGDDCHAIAALSGAEAYLHKPVEVTSLLKTIRELLGS